MEFKNENKTTKSGSGMCMIQLFIPRMRGTSNDAGRNYSSIYNFPICPVAEDSWTAAGA